MPLLQSQLQRPTKKVHLLLDDNYGEEVLLQVALEGLVKLDLSSDLFAVECHLTGKELKNELIEFLNQLAPYLNTMDALKCMDFLIRKYNLLSLDILHVLLPYHEMSWFPKILLGMKESVLVQQLKHCNGKTTKSNFFKLLNEIELRQIIDSYLSFVVKHGGYPMLYSSFASIIVKIKNVEYVTFCLSKSISLNNEKLVIASCFALGELLTIQVIPFQSLSSVFVQLLQHSSKSSIMMAVFILKRTDAVISDDVSEALLSKSSSIISLSCNVSHCIPTLFKLAIEKNDISTLLSIFKSSYGTIQMATTAMDILSDNPSPLQIQLANLLNNKFSLHSKSLNASLYGHDPVEQINALSRASFSNIEPDLLNLLQFAPPPVVLFILNNLEFINTDLMIHVSSLSFHSNPKIAEAALLVLNKFKCSDCLALHNAVVSDTVYTPIDTSNFDSTQLSAWCIHLLDSNHNKSCSLLIPHLKLHDIKNSVIPLLNESTSAIIVRSILSSLKSFLLLKSKSSNNPSIEFSIFNQLFIFPNIFQLSFELYDFKLFLELCICCITSPLHHETTRRALNHLVFIDSSCPDTALSFLLQPFNITTPYKSKLHNFNTNAIIQSIFNQLPSSSTEWCHLLMRYCNTNYYCTLLLKYSQVDIKMLKECFIRNQFYNELDLLQVMMYKCDVNDLISFVSSPNVLKHSAPLKTILDYLVTSNNNNTTSVFSNYIKCTDEECSNYYKLLLGNANFSDLYPLLIGVVTKATDKANSATPTNIGTLSMATSSSSIVATASIGLCVSLLQYYITTHDMSKNTSYSQLVCKYLDVLMLDNNHVIVTRCFDLILHVFELGLPVEVNQLKLLQSFKQHQHVQIHQQILKCYCFLIELEPTNTLDNICNIFVLISSNMYKCDNDYNYEIIHSFIKIVSRYPDVGELVEIIKSTYDHIPIHRRLPLFTTLVMNVNIYMQLYNSIKDDELFGSILQELPRQIALPYLLELPVNMTNGYLSSITTDNMLDVQEYELVVPLMSINESFELLCQSMSSSLLRMFIQDNRVLPCILNRIKQGDGMYLDYLCKCTNDEMLLNMMIASAYASDFDSKVLNTILPLMNKQNNRLNTMSTACTRKILHLTTILVNHDIVSIPVAMDLINNITVVNEIKQRFMQLIMTMFKHSHFIGSKLSMLWLRLLPFIHEYNNQDLIALHPRLHIQALLKIKEDLVKMPSTGLKTIFSMIYSMINSMDKQEFIVYHGQLNDLFVYVMVHISTSDGLGVLRSIYSAYVGFCLKLNDALFKPIFMQILGLLANNAHLIILLQEFCSYMKQLFSPYAQLMKPVILELNCSGLMELFGMIVHHTDNSYLDVQELKEICKRGFEIDSVTEQGAFFGYMLMACKQSWTYILPRLNDFCQDIRGLQILREMTVVMGANYNEILSEVLPSIAEAMDYHQAYCVDELIPAIEGATHANVMDMLK